MESVNNTFPTNHGKLYLDLRTADVHFIFGPVPGPSELVPAHKTILSRGSPVFQTMFYGSLIEQGYVEIVDATAAEFKEFLKFFYQRKVQLSHKNIVKVTYLCKKYGLTDALQRCETFLQHNLPYNHLCEIYCLASFLELKSLAKFCGKEIQKYASVILQSKKHLRSNRMQFEKLMELLQHACSHLEMVEAYMEWAKAECLRKDLDENATNLRAQIGDLFEQMPFHKLELEEFSAFIASHQGFLTAEELEKMIQQIALNKATASEQQRVNQSTPPEAELICNRTSDIRAVSKYSITMFSANNRVILTGFSVGYKRIVGYDLFIDLTYSVSFRRSNLGPEKIIVPKLTIPLTMPTVGNVQVNLLRPIHIRKVGIYKIELKFNRHMPLFKYPALPVPLSNGTLVKFMLNKRDQDDNVDAISTLIFESE